MQVIFLMAVFCFTAVVANTCSNEDETLLSYIKWQMKTTTILKEGSGKCECKTEDRRTIAFNAQLEKSLENLPANTVVKFGSVTLNDGKGYDPSTGVFTCPLDGVYTFSWTICTWAGSKFFTEIRVNDSALAFNFCTGHSGTQNSASQTVVAKLKKGDNVRVQVFQNNGKYALANWSSFCGNKI